MGFLLFRIDAKLPLKGSGEYHCTPPLKIHFLGTGSRLSRASLHLNPQWPSSTQLHVGRLPDTAPRSFYLSWTPQSLSFAPFPTPLPPRRASLQASCPLPLLPPPRTAPPPLESQRIYANYFKPAPSPQLSLNAPGPALPVPPARRFLPSRRSLGGSSFQ